MAEQDLGGSWTAQRYCHSEARISWHVVAEHAGVSEKRATMIELVFWIKKRPSSYSQISLAVLCGGWASCRARSAVIGLVDVESDGCVKE